MTESYIMQTLFCVQFNNIKAQNKTKANWRTIVNNREREQEKEVMTKREKRNNLNY